MRTISTFLISITDALKTQLNRVQPTFFFACFRRGCRRKENSGHYSQTRGLLVQPCCCTAVSILGGCSLSVDDDGLLGCGWLFVVGARYRGSIARYIVACLLCCVDPKTGVRFIVPRVQLLQGLFEAWELSVSQPSQLKLFLEKRV